MTRLLVAATCFVLFCLPAYGQQGIDFRAVVDARTITAGDYLTVEFTLFNARGTEFKAPDFRDFIVQSGPSTAIRQSSVNGRMSSEFSFRYTLLPKRKGELRIGSASIKVKNQIYQTDPLRVEVVEAREREGSLPMILELIPSSHTIWLGQQLNLDYTLFFRTQWKDINIIKEPSYPDQAVQELQRFSMRPVREVIDGQTYIKQIIRRKALFPQRSGVMTIDTLMVQVGIQEGGTSSFFNISPLKYRLFKSDTVQVRVRPLLSDPPAGFTGAVGSYRSEIAINSTTLSALEAFELTVAIQGDGDVKRVFAPDLTLPPNLELYEKRVMEENSFDLNGVLIGRKVFKYTLLPKATGKITLAPNLYYFSPDSATYLPLTHDTFRLFVSPDGEGKALEQTEEASTETGLLPLKLDTGLEGPKAVFAGTPTFWLWILSPFLLLGLWVGLVFAKKWYDGREPVFDGGKAKALFLKELARIESLDQPGVASLQDQWRIYLQRELNQPASARKGELLAAMKNQNWTTERIESVKSIWGRMDQLQYAGFNHGQGMDALFGAIRSYINSND